MLLVHLLRLNTRDIISQSECCNYSFVLVDRLHGRWRSWDCGWVVGLWLLSQILRHEWYSCSSFRHFLFDFVNSILCWIQRLICRLVRNVCSVMCWAFSHGAVRKCLYRRCFEQQIIWCSNLVFSRNVWYCFFVLNSRSRMWYDQFVSIYRLRDTLHWFWKNVPNFKRHWFCLWLHNRRFPSAGSLSRFHYWRFWWWDFDFRPIFIRTLVHEKFLLSCFSRRRLEQASLIL